MRKLLIFLVVLILLVVGVDIGGRALAESKTGEAIASKTGTSAPSVVIHGFSFLVQAVRGRYQNISLNSSDITAGPITGIDADVELYDVEFPLGDAIKGDTSHLTAGQARLRGVVADTDVSSAIATQAGVAGLTDASVSAGSNGAIRVSATISVAGQQVPVSADMIASYVSGVLHLDASNVAAAGVTLPNVAQLTKGLSLALPLEDLPFTVDAATLTSSGSDLILTASANDVRVDGQT